jgi:hypothetical protein
MRNLEPRKGKARHAPRHEAQARGVAFLAILEEHLQPDADAEERLRARRLEHRLARAARREVAHAIGQRALSGDDNALGPADCFRVGCQ